MTRIVPPILLLFLFIFPRAIPACAPYCRFRLCQLETGIAQPPGATLLVRAPLRALDYVCRPKLRRLGLIRSTGEALLSLNSTALTPISKYRPAGISRRFSKRFFRLYDVPSFRGRQGVGRRRGAGNQTAFLNGLCVALPVTKWDVLGRDGTVAKTVESSRRRNCVSFVVKVPVVLVELVWNSADDLDLSLLEPDRDVIDNRRPESEAGKLMEDHPGDTCASNELGVVAKEEIVYALEDRDLVDEGVYTASVKHFTNCGFGPTDWVLTVTVDDRVVLQEKGTSNLPSGNKISEISFEVKF